MTNLIKASFYKIVRMKSFYVCGFLGIITAILYIWSINVSFGISPALFGFTGVSALMSGLTSGGLFCTIFISSLVSNEFSFGTIKNIISSGQSRLSIYFTKLIMALFTVIVYTVTCGLASFVLGSALWGAGEISRNDYLDMFRAIGLVIIAEFAMQCLFVMVGFLFRRPIGTVVVNVIISMGVSIFLPIINFLVRSLFKVKTFEIEKYWPAVYSSNFSSLNISSETITTGLIVCAAMIIISSFIGIFTFMKRDIK